MKRILIFILFWPLNLSAQVDLINISLKDTNKSHIYIGVNNRIEIRGIEIDTLVNLKASQLRIEKSRYKFNQFDCTASSKGIDTLKLYRKDSLILSKPFNIDRINDPVAYFGNLTDTIATVSEILQNAFLRVEIPKCYYDHGFRIIEFEMGFYINSIGDTVLTGKTTGFKLLDDHLKIIEQLESGEKIIFTRLLASCNDCTLRRLQPFTITVR